MIYWGKIVLYYNCNKDSVSNFSSSRQTKQAGTLGMDWFTIDVEVTYLTRKGILSVDCKVIHGMLCTFYSEIKVFSLMGF